jgi:hypothetical protein
LQLKVLSVSFQLLCLHVIFIFIPHEARALWLPQSIWTIPDPSGLLVWLTTEIRAVVWEQGFLLLHPWTMNGFIQRLVIFLCALPVHLLSFLHC